MAREKPKSTGEKVYSDVATFGRTYTYLEGVGAVIMASLLIFGGVYLIVHRDADSATTTAFVTSQVGECVTTQNDGRGGGGVSCRYMVQYTVNGDKYTAAVSDSRKYAIGESVTLHYNPHDPKRAEIRTRPFKTVGGVLVGVGVLVLLTTAFKVYMARKYKVYAAASGASAGVSMVRDALR